MSTLYDLLYNAYIDKPIYKKPNHILIRCPFCGDSIKNYNHAHLYIEPELKVFWCARCYIGGTLHYLLHVIKDRFNPVYFETLLELSKHKKEKYSIGDESSKFNISNIDDKTINLLNKKFKLSIKTDKEIEIIQNFLIDKFSIYLEKPYIHQLPLFIGNKLDPIKLNNYLCWFTLSDNLIFCRSMINTRIFKSVKLDYDIDDSQLLNNNRCTIFSYKIQKIESYNKLNSKKTFIIAEGLTDLLIYSINNNLFDKDNVYFVSTNGKYKDDLNFIINTISNKYNDNFIFLIDKDAVNYETNFIKKLDIKNRKIIYPLYGSDYRSSNEKYIEVTIN